MAHKRKANCTPEEWALIVEKRRAERKRERLSAAGKAAKARYYQKHRQQADAYSRVYRWANIERYRLLDNRRHARGRRREVAKFMIAVRRAVPSTLPREMHDDVMAAVLMRLWRHQKDPDCIARAVADEIKAYNRQYDTFRSRSLDEIVAGTDNLRLGDTIASDREHF